MSLPPYPEYKPSGVEWLGDVPEHWAMKRLKQVCHVFPSNVDKKSHDGEMPVKLCNYTDVYYNETITADMEFMAATASTEQVAKFALRAGDTIITKDSETADDIAIGAYVPVDLPNVVCGYHLSMIRPKAGTHGAFVKRLFDSTYVKSCVEVRANGLTRVGLGQYQIDNIDLPFPPIDEQQTIAAFLDRETGKIDALIAEQRRLVGLLAEKRQAVISHVVTKGLTPLSPRGRGVGGEGAAMKDSGIAWLGDVPAHWEVVPLKHLISLIESGVSVNASDYPATETELGVLKTSCVYSGQFDASENKTVIQIETGRVSCPLKLGTLIVSRMNTPELVGAAGLVKNAPPNVYLPDRLWQVSFHSTDSAFVHYWTQSVFYRAQIRLVCAGTSSSMQNLGQDQFRSFSFPKPPLAEQHAIAAFLDTETAKFDTLTAEANRAIALLQERRSALISAAVTGKIDVRSAG